MCEFCKKIWESEDEFTKSSMFFNKETAIVVKEEQFWLYNADRSENLIFWSNDSEPIERCPKCGRKLGEENL